ncbi:MAG: 3-phosphoshikimate 1-carboxyvinyltransferase [Opitutaceae bacterium]|nr:3-phosphoshikimate 1-carboxyvinyltransferase [Opitutaceae bacterium]
MPLADPLPITPFTYPISGVVELPGSKSITNRALILAALAEGTTTLTGALFSRDSRIMVAGLQTLGFVITADESTHTIVVEGRGGEIPISTAKINVGNAGTAARFLTALVCLHPNGTYEMNGDEAMSKRPIGSLLDALTEQGAHADSLSFPFTLKTAGLRGGEVSVDASESSQLLSALLLAGSRAQAPLNINITGEPGSRPFVEMTKRVIEQFSHKPSTYAVEGDASAASYLLTLPLVTGGEIKFPNYHGDLQGDLRYLEVVRHVSLQVDEEDGGRRYFYARDTRLKPVEQNFREFSDTFLTIAAIAPLLDGPTKITGIAHTRKQETDRVTGMARELIKLGQKVIETEDSLEIHPQPLKSGVEIETYEDHRFAMSFGILGCHDLHGDGGSWLSIKDPACCGKTFPTFFEVLESLRQTSIHS